MGGVAVAPATARDTVGYSVSVTRGIVGGAEEDQVGAVCALLALAVVVVGISVGASPPESKGTKVK